MRTEQLDALVEISRTPSLTVASGHVHLTVQALSMSIKALEEEMEVALLHRTHQGVSLTAEGQALVSLYGDFQRGVAQIKRQKLSIEGELMLPVNFNGLMVFLPQLLCGLEVEAPGLRLDIMEMPQDHIVEELRSGVYEVALICLLAEGQRDFYNLAEGLTFLPLVSTRALCQLSPNHALAERKSISIATLAATPLVTLRPDLASQSSLITFLQTYDSRLRAEFTNSQSLYKARVISGRRVGLTAEHQITFADGAAVVNIPVKENIRAYFGCAWRKDAALSPLAAFFVQYLRKYAQPEAGAER